MDTPETQSKEFTSDLIHCTALKMPNCTVDLSVKASKALIDTAKTQAIKSISKSVTVPGFRRGKAPESLINESFSKEIEKSTKDALVRLSYAECRRLTSIENLDPKESFSYQIESFSFDEAKLSLSFEIAPTVPTVDPSTFTLNPVTRPEVSPAKIDETIRQALFFHAKWDTISDRPVMEGDFIILDATVIDEGVPANPLFKGTRFEVTDKSMARWMKDAVLGKNTGDVTEGISVADEDATEEEKALFKPSKVQMTIQAIEKATLPELTEDLIQKLGASSEEDLKKKIEDQLNIQADEHVSENLREQVLDFLIKNYSFNLPKSLIRKELEFRTSQLAQDTSFMDHWNSLKEPEKQKMIAFLTSQTEKSIILSFLCSSLIKQANLKLPERSGSSPGSFGEYSQKMLIKATDYIIEQATQKVASC